MKGRVRSGWLICGFVLAIGLLVGFRAEAATMPINWTGPNEFSVSTTITFPSFFAQSLDGITGTGSYHAHPTSTPATVFIDIGSGGPFTNIFTQTTTGSTPLSSITFPVDFADQTINSLRLSATSADPWEFHSMTGTVFNFQTPDQPPTGAVPEPGTMLLLGSGMIGMVPFIRRKFKK